MNSWGGADRDDLKLHLRLEWAGKHEHSDKEPIGHLYKRAPAGSR